MSDIQKEKLTDSAAFLSGRQSIIVLPVANQFGAAAVPISGCRTRDLGREDENVNLPVETCQQTSSADTQAHPV